MSSIISTTKEKPLVIYSRVNEDGIPKLLTFVNSDGTPHPITSYNFEYLLKSKAGNDKNIFRLSIGNRLTVQGDDSNELLFEISAEIASIRPMLYFGLLRSVSEDHTWLNTKHHFIDGYFEGVTDSDTLTISQDGETVLITITGRQTGFCDGLRKIAGTNNRDSETDYIVMRYKLT